MRIGELAALAGVTTRTVRHYHHLGLLPEPARRANGYREYGLRDAVALARVRRLTELGLSLEEVRDVLAAPGPDAGRELCEVLAELDADLARQEEALRGRRARVRELLELAERGELPAEGPVSAELAALFGEMARAGARLPGPEPAMAAKERELLALLETAPDGAGRELVAALGGAGGDPAAMDRMYRVYALLDELSEADVDDPRVARAARAAAGEAARAVAAAVPLPVRRLVAHEVRVVASLVQWAARRPHGVGSGDRAVPYAGGQAALVYGLLFAAVVETAVLAVLPAEWPVVHAAVLVLDVWGVALVLGFHAACAARPHVVGADGSLRVRYGALVDVAVPAGSVTAVRVEHRFPPGRTVEVSGGVLDLAVGGRTTVTVELGAPVEVVRPLGGRERARVLRLYADDPRAAVAALRGHVVDGAAGRAGPERG